MENKVKHAHPCLKNDIIWGVDSSFACNSLKISLYMKQYVCLWVSDGVTPLVHVYPRAPDSSEGLIPRAIIYYIGIDP